MNKTEFFAQGSAKTVKNGEVLQDASIQLHSPEGKNMNMNINLNGKKMLLRNVDIRDVAHMNALLPLKRNNDIDLMDKLENHISRTAPSNHVLLIKNKNNHSMMKQKFMKITKKDTKRTNSKSTSKNRRKTIKKHAKAKKLPLKKKPVKKQTKKKNATIKRVRINKKALKRGSIKNKTIVKTPHPLQFGTKTFTPSTKL
jgi:hypothetical protein